MVVVGLKRPEREGDRRSRWSSLWWSGAGPLDFGRRPPRADRPPASEVWAARSGSTGTSGCAPRSSPSRSRHERPPPRRLGAAPSPPVAEPYSGPRAQHGRTVRLTRESVGRGSPYRARSGGTWELSAWRRPIRSVVMVRPKRFPARGCGSNERATGRRPACPYLEEVKLLRRPAPLGSGRAGAGSRPASARPCASLGSAAGVLAGGDERIEGDIEGCGGGTGR
jgi:hypothetical protein